MVELVSPTESYASVRQVGRWTYEVILHRGISFAGPRRVWGSKQRAEKKAWKLLTEYDRKERQRKVPPTIVRLTIPESDPEDGDDDNRRRGRT